MGSLKNTIVKYFMTNSNIDDAKFHAFCEKNGLDTHEAETEVYKLLSGFFNMGKYKNIDLSTVDQNEYKKGIPVEKEHTNDTMIASKIVLDHLAEDPKYYTKLSGAKL